MQISDARDVTVIFLHIPKAAGSTLHSVLRGFYPRDAVCHIPVAKPDREAVYADLSLEERARIRLIKGHLLFGIHRHVPDRSTYITVLRHPIDRVVSHYYYVRRTPRHRLFERLTSSDMSLEAYVSSKAALELNNGQVRALYGPDHLRVEYGECKPAMFEQAIHNLRTHFSAVGLTDRFDESLLLMRHLLGWSRWPFYVARNVAENRPAVRRVPPHVIRKIEQDNELDLELYEIARRSFAEQMERYEISKQLERFRTWNGVYGRCAAPFCAVRSTLGRITKRRTAPGYV